jgi:hypothetical protein
VLLIFAAAFAFGPAQSIARGVRRRVAVALSIALAGGAYLVLRPLHGAAAQAVALSTSQWISLLTALCAAFAWHRALGTGAPMHGARAQPRPLSST